MEEEASTTMSSPPWSDLPPDLLGHVVARLPFPSDRAHFRVVCRAWYSAARQHIRPSPWIMSPDCSFCTIGDDGALFHRIPNLPDNATCLGAAADNWLALDYTDDMSRRTLFCKKFFFNMKPSEVISHRHTYLLHNPFSGETVPLPELDSIFGHIPETYQITKVLMRSPSNPNDVVVVVTDSWKYNLVLFCRGKGKWIPQCCLNICDVAFLGDRLYGINPEEELIAFDLGEDEDGMLTVNTCRRVIKKPLADGEADLWSWMYDEDTDNEEEEDNDDHDDDDDDGEDDDEEEEEQEEDNNDQDDDDDEEEEDEVDEELLVDSNILNTEKGADRFNDKLHALCGIELTPYETNKGQVLTTRRLVTSHSGRELLMVRHHTQLHPCSDPYTLKVEVFKANINIGNWVSVTTDALGKGEALFHSRSFSRSTPAYRDVKEGSIYFLDTYDVFNANCWARTPFSMPQEMKLQTQELLTWFFPPELVV